MMYMKHFAEQWIINEGHLRREGFALVLDERMLLERARRPEYFTTSLAKRYQSPDLNKLEPRWTKEALLQVFEQVVQTQAGFLIYDDLCQQFGEEVIDSMIEHHLLHLRPNREFSYDLPSAPDDKAIVTPMSPAARYAMKLILQEYGKLPTPKPREALPAEPPQGEATEPHASPAFRR